MPASGRPWAREAAAFRRECEQRGAACWICQNSRGPIRYDAEPRTPLSFSIDHVTPTSMGGDPVRRANLKPAHYLLVQQQPRQRITRRLPHHPTLVTTAARRGGAPTSSPFGGRPPGRRPFSPHRKIDAFWAFWRFRDGCSR